MFRMAVAALVALFALTGCEMTEAEHKALAVLQVDLAARGSDPAISKRMDVLSTDATNQNLSIFIARGAEPAHVAMLLKAGIKADQDDPYLGAPLAVAIRRLDPEVVAILLTAGAHPDSNGYPGLLAILSALSGLETWEGGAPAEKRERAFTILALLLAYGANPSLEVHLPGTGETLTLTDALSDLSKASRERAEELIENAGYEVP